jgi:putative copper export protein
MESRAAVVGVSASMLTIMAGFSRMFFEARMIRAMPGMDATTMQSVLMGTAWGAAMRIQIIAAFLAMIAFAIAIKRIRGAWLIASLAGAILAATPALSGHAAAATHLSGVLIATDFIHVVGASSWLGNLACVMFIGVPILFRAGGEDRWQSIAALVNTFSAVALASAVIVVLSGIIATWIHLEHFSSLWLTTYGKVLLLKLALVMVTILTGAYNFRRVQPALVHEEGTTRLRRSTALELSTAALIVLVTGFLTGIAP